MSARRGPSPDDLGILEPRLSLPQPRSVQRPEIRLSDSEHARSASTRASSIAQARPHPSRVFRYLADTAERISRGPVLDWAGDTWMDDSRSVLATSPAQPPQALSRINLTRRYSGRPHVPGEDSGSDNEDEIEAEQHALSVSDSRSRPRTVSRSRDYADRMPNVPGAWPGEEQVTQSYSTAGDTPTEDSIYDWAPLRDTAEPTELARTASIRRWRPSERLQDFASSTAARREASSTGDDTLTPSHLDTTRLDLGRAMRDYRLARRAIRRRSADYDIDDMLRSQNREIIASVRSSIRRTPTVTSADFHNEHPPLIPQDRLSGGDTDPNRGPSSSDRTDNRAENDQGRTDDDREAHFRAGLRLNLSNAAVRTQRLAMTNLRDSAWLSIASDSLASGPLFNQGPTAPVMAAQRVGDDQESGRDEDLLSGSADFAEQRSRRLVETYTRFQCAEEGIQSSSRSCTKAVLYYLKRLRENKLNYVQAWQLAHRLKLKSIGAATDCSPALPMSSRDMPKPVPTSWLEPGMVWVGRQTADNPSSQGARMLHRQRQRQQRSRNDQSPRSREAQERMEYTQRQNNSFRARISNDRRTGNDQTPTMDALERTLLGSGRFSLLSWRESMRVLEDAERDLSTMLEWTNERIAQEDSRWASRVHLPETAQESEVVPSTSNVQVPSRDHWRVKVDIHSVDWQKKTLTGTMSASQFPDRASLGYQPLRNQSSDAQSTTSNEDTEAVSPDNTTMDSFFTGEIIDFERFGFDSSPSFLPAKLSRLYEQPENANEVVRQEKMLDLDVHHWAGLGPFKMAVDSAIRKEQEELTAHVGRMPALETKASQTSGTSTSIDPNGPSAKVADDTLKEKDKCIIRDNILLKLLGDKDWLDKTFGSETGTWILMRWKEKCFVSPGTEPNPDAHRPYYRGSHEAGDGRSRLWTTDNASLQQRGAEAEARRHFFTSEQSAVVASGSWALTISGFYYVALHRQTGRIEALYCDDNGNDTQSWPRLDMRPEDEIRDLAEGSNVAEFTEVDDVAAGLRSCFPVIEMR